MPVCHSSERVHSPQTLAGPNTQRFQTGMAGISDAHCEHF